MAVQKLTLTIEGDGAPTEAAILRMLEVLRAGLRQVIEEKDPRRDKAA